MVFDSPSPGRHPKLADQVGSGLASIHAESHQAPWIYRLSCSWLLARLPQVADWGSLLTPRSPLAGSLLELLKHAASTPSRAGTHTEPSLGPEHGENMPTPKLEHQTGCNSTLHYSHTHYRRALSALGGSTLFLTGKPNRRFGLFRRRATQSQSLIYPRDWVVFFQAELGCQGAGTAALGLRRGGMRCGIKPAPGGGTSTASTHIKLGWSPPTSWE